jgi:hypothetical protein
LYNEDIDVLAAAVGTELPSGGQRGEIPRWIDFLGDANVQAWAEIIKAFTFICATRGPLAAEGIYSALDPIAEPFEVEMITRWGQQTGVLQELSDGQGVTVREWWWLAAAKLRKE